MPGLMNYGQGLQQQQSKQEMFKEEGGSPMNVLSTITPDSLTKMMQRIGGGVGVGAEKLDATSTSNPSAGVGSSPSTGLSKKGHTGEETNKFLGFNQEGLNNTFEWLDKYTSPTAGSSTNATMNLLAPGTGSIRAMFHDED